MKRKQMLAFISPSMVSLLIFTIIPLVVAFSLSTQSFGYWTINDRIFCRARQLCLYSNR